MNGYLVYIYMFFSNIITALICLQGCCYYSCLFIVYGFNLKYYIFMLN